MAKLVKWGVSGSEVDEIEVEDREDFEPYDGPMPPKNKILRVKAVKITAVKFSTGSRGVKLFMVVDDPANERYNGLPYWENVQDMASTNWKIRQFMDSIGGTGADWDKTYIEEVADGDPIVTKFGKIKTDGLFLRIQHKTGANQDGDPRAEVARFLKKSEGAAKATAAKRTNGSAASTPDDEEPPF
jgi:hypothetical protein